MGAIFGLLLFIGFVIHYFWWIAVGAAVLYGWYKWRVIKLACQMMNEAEAKRQADIADRADQQHAWTLARDLRGIYGRAWNTVRSYMLLVG
jgi:hypothetical protein